MRLRTRDRLLGDTASVTGVSVLFVGQFSTRLIKPGKRWAAPCGTPRHGVLVVGTDKFRVDIAQPDGNFRGLIVTAEHAQFG